MQANLIVTTLPAGRRPGAPYLETGGEKKERKIEVFFSF